MNLVRTYNSKEFDYNLFVRMGDALKTYSSNCEKNGMLSRIENKVADVFYKIGKEDDVVYIGFYFLDPES